MAQNNNRLNRNTRIYALATQGIFTMVLLLGIGFYIGYQIDKNSPWPAILAVIGMLIGLVIFITYLLYLLKEDKNDKKSKD